MNKAIFFDRDGVINIDKGYVHKIEDLEWVPGIKELLVHAVKHGYLLFIITNQSGIARGMYSSKDVNVLHAYISKEMAQYGVSFAHIFHCPHHPEFTGKCLCRKPGTLFVEKAKYLFDLSLDQSWFIGDKESDIEAGRSTRTRTILLAGDVSSQADFVIHSHKDLIGLL